MNNLLEQKNIPSSLSSRKPFPSHRQCLLYLLIWNPIIAALVASIILLLSDVFSITPLHAPVSASPLLLIGVSHNDMSILSKYLAFLTRLCMRIYLFVSILKMEEGEKRDRYLCMQENNLVGAWVSPHPPTENV